MGEIIKFFSYDSLYEYVRTQLNAPIDYISQDTWTYWKDIIGDMIGKRARAVPKYDPLTGRDSWEYEFETFDSETIVPGQSYSVSGSTTGATSSTATATATEAIGGGGVKKPPTLTKVVTDNATGESTLGEPATGIKNVGVATKVPVQNILTGLMAAYGLYSLAVTASNWHTWEDVFNTVFPGALPEDATIQDVIDFAKGKYQLYIGGVIEAQTLNVYVPESIVERMYNYLAQHMEEDGTVEGLELNMLSFSLLQGGWSRYSNVSRYFTYLPAPQGNTVVLNHVYFSENLVHNWILDAMQQMIGLGFSVSQSTTGILLDQTNAIVEYIRTHAPSASVLTYKYVDCIINVGRPAHTPKSQPISPSEVSIEIRFWDDSYMEIEDNLVTFNIPSGLSRFLKYGKTGEEIDDFAYKVVGSHSYNTMDTFTVYIEFPANTMEITDSGEIEPVYVGGVSGAVINGYNEAALDTDESIPDDSPYSFEQAWSYSNIGYIGAIKNYKPDSTLSAIAGKDDKDGKTKLRPAAAGTGLAWDDRYRQWAERSKKRGTVNSQGQNAITTDVPVQIPFGSKNADKIIEHGYNNPDDPDSYQNLNDQDDEQTGRLPEDTPMDDVNDAIQDTVDDYDDSRYDPEDLPDPVAPDVPLPDYPEDPGSEDEDETDDPPDIPVMPGMTASGMCSVYNPTKEQLKNFSAWLWSLDPLENLKKILTNPIDAIIGLHIMYATPSVTTASNIICGYLDSGVAAPVVDQQFIEVDCGYVDVPEYYGNATDYEPYTHVNCYLPFIGIVSLKANDVIGKRLYISYGVDVLTGTCLARLTTKKGNSMILLYTFAGNCSTQIPLTGGDYAQVIRGIASMAVGIAGSVVTANPLPAIGGVISGAMSSSLDVSRSGSIGANAGAMGVRKPYLIITRRAAYDASSYDRFYGFPANKTVKLSACSGYTRVKSVHIDSMGVATDAEVSEIETLLRQGIIIK